METQRVEGFGGRSFDVSAVEEEQRGESIREIQDVYVALDKVEGERLSVIVGLPGNDVLLIVPLAALVGRLADENTPGDGANPDAWNELADLGKALSEMAIDVADRVSRRDTSGYTRAWAPT